MSWTPYHSAVRDALASLFPDREDVRTLLDEAGVPVGHVALGHRPITNWHESVREAANRGKLERLVEVASSRYPDNQVLAELRRGNEPTEPPEVKWRGTPGAEPDLEKITGLRPTLLPVSFLERGVSAARSVARIRVPEAAGSGFLIARDLLVTNHHVVASEAVARLARVWFNYQKKVDGSDATVDEYELAPEDGFVTSKDDDWTVVRVKANSTSRASGAWGFLELVDVPIAVDDPVNIIQHPLGGPKQVALYHNLVAYVDERIVQYLTDTEPGSSGSPVFNDAWQVVAIHRAGRHVKQPPSRVTFIRNEGVRGGVVLAALRRLGLYPT
jgi:V8-like Glu-specific endopeptidase